MLKHARIAELERIIQVVSNYPMVSGLSNLVRITPSTCRIALCNAVCRSWSKRTGWSRKGKAGGCVTRSLPLKYQLMPQRNCRWCELKPKSTSRFRLKGQKSKPMSVNPSRVGRQSDTTTNFSKRTSPTIPSIFPRSCDLNCGGSARRQRRSSNLLVPLPAIFCIGC